MLLFLCGSCTENTVWQPHAYNSLQYLLDELLPRQLETEPDRYHYQIAISDVNKFLSGEVCTQSSIFCFLENSND